MSKKPAGIVRQLAGPTPEVKAEKIEKTEHLLLPAALLLAAESVALKDGAKTSRPYLSSIYLHARHDKGRMVTGDGVKLFLASFAVPDKQNGGVPGWLKEGILLSTDGLRSRLSLLTKLSSPEAHVRVSCAKGAVFAELSDLPGSAKFRMELEPGPFPDYDRFISDRSFSTLDEDGEVAHRDWQPVGINSVYLKHVGDIAKQLEGGLDKNARSKNGMVVRAFNGGDAAAPLVFDFSTWPGAILVVMQSAPPTLMISKESAVLLAPAARGSVAALKAHATRNRVWAEETTDPVAKAEFLAKAAAFEVRVRDLLRFVPGAAALAAPMPAPAPEPIAVEIEPAAPPASEPEPEAPPASEAEAPPAEAEVTDDKTRVTRRSIKVAA